MLERVVVAMSGGVDSSVAAARLKRQGYEVVGVTLHLWDYPDDGSVKGRCCAPEDIHDARRVCDVLDIPHYAFDRRALFEAEVVTPFVESYLEGVTPSPCVRCNRGVKMRELFVIAERLGARRVATGHYARIAETPQGPHLLRAVDETKDQSYFLHTLRDEELRQLCFPLGELLKKQVRDEAVRLALPGAHKGESQELCFVPTGRYDTFVDQRAPHRVRPGRVLHGVHDVGAHSGVHRFTVGQRRNLGVAVGERAYVVEVDAAAATVRLGGRDELMCDVAVLEELSLAGGVALPVTCGVSVRYRGRPHRARVLTGQAGAAEVHFEEPVAAVVPGQFAVFYDGDRVLGGGMIVHASSVRPRGETAESRVQDCG